MILRNAIRTGIAILGLMTVLPLLPGSGSLPLSASAFDGGKSSYSIPTRSAGATGAPSVAPQRGSNHSIAVMGTIESTLQAISNLQAKMQQLLEAIQSHLANKPKPPGKKATREEKNKYQAALHKWENQLTQLHKQLNGQQKNLEKRQAELTDLQNRQLPEAQSMDAQKARDAREAQGKNAGQGMRRTR